MIQKIRHRLWKWWRIRALKRYQKILRGLMMKLNIKTAEMDPNSEEFKTSVYLDLQLVIVDTMIEEIAKEKVD